MISRKRKLELNKPLTTREKYRGIRDEERKFSLLMKEFSNIIKGISILRMATELIKDILIPEIDIIKPNECVVHNNEIFIPYWVRKTRVFEYPLKLGFIEDTKRLLN